MNQYKQMDLELDLTGKMLLRGGVNDERSFLEQEYKLWDRVYHNPYLHILNCSSFIEGFLSFKIL